MDDIQVTDDISFDTLKELDEIPLGPTTHALVHTPFEWRQAESGE